MPTGGVDDLGDNVEQAPLIRRRRDLASQKPRLSSVADIGGSKTAGCDAKHGEIGLIVADGNRLGIRCQDPVAKGNKACPLVDLLGHDSYVERGFTKCELIEPQIV